MRILAALSIAVAAVVACSSFTSTDAPGASDNEAGADGSAIVDATFPSDDAADANDAISAAYRAAVLEDEPQAYWRMDTTSGFSVPDESGNGHALTLLGTSELVPGAVPGSGAIRFDGRTGSGTVTAVLAATKTAAYSVECWVNLDGAFDGGATYRVFWSQATNGTNVQNGALSFFGRTDAGAWRLVTARAAGTNQDAPYVADDWFDRFVHVVTTYDGTNLTLWVNGVPQANRSSLSLAGLPPEFLVGKTDYGAYFAGTIDELAVYDHALTVDRIQAHRAAALPKH